MAEMQNPTIVIAGNGMVGYKFCEKFRAKNIQCNIIVFAEETRPAYDRVHLSEYFSGKTAQDLALSSFEWYAENDITLHLGDPVHSIDRDNKTITSLKGAVQSYDFLVLATGSSAFVPQIPGTEKEGVFVYRTIEDLEIMKAFSRKATKGAVLGGGLLGLEAAKALIDLGLTETHVIEF